LTRDIDTTRCEGFEVTILPEQRTIKDKKTIKALTVIPPSILSNVRLIYELGDVRLQNGFLRLLHGCLRELSLETLGSDESYKAEVERVLKINQEILTQKRLEQEMLEKEESK